MVKQNNEQPSDLESDLEMDYTLPMRVFGGVAWGTVVSLIIGTILVVIPQYPRPWLWVVPIVWTLFSWVGISLQWSVARGPCPKCGTVQTVPAPGKRCPDCRSYLKAVDRKVVKF